LSAQNVRTSQILEYMAVQYGGKQNLRFKKKDVSNQIVAENRKLLGVDVDTTLMYFQKKQEDDAQRFSFFINLILYNFIGLISNYFF
jgi:hypothetical protein